MCAIYRIKTISILLLTALFLSNCAGFEPTQVIPTSSSTPILQITPYWTPTSSPTSVSPTPTISPSATPLPSPTPFTHTIVQGDMLGGIAFQYGLTVEDLLAANPDIDPGLLTIGSTVVVPLKEEGLLVESTPIPMPILLEGPDCYPTNDDGTFCVLLATNIGETGVENLSAKIVFLSGDGEPMAEEVAITPLNVLLPGESLPMQVFFSIPFETGMQAYGEIISALPLTEHDSRYSNAEVELEEVVVEPDGDQAFAQGLVTLPADRGQPDYLWVAAVAYDENGEVVGIRKWEAPAGQSCPDVEVESQPVEPGDILECLSFELTVFSLGPEIERVEVHVEAGYQPEP